MTRSQRRGMGLGAVAVILAGIGIGADGPTQTVDAGGLTFEVPASWKSSRPSSAMRKAELKVAPVEGDGEPAELVVFAFPGGAGTVEANIKRWQGQFKDADGNPPRIESRTMKGKNVEVTRVETAGHYYPTTFPGQPKQADHADYRLLGAIAQAGNVGYFFKMVGPDKTMKSAREAFDQMIASMTAANQ